MFTKFSAFFLAVMTACSATAPVYAAPLEFSDNWGFHMTDGAAEGDTTYTFENGSYIYILEETAVQSNDNVVVMFNGIDIEASFSAWVADFDHYDLTGEWVTFDIHLNPHWKASNCNVFVSPTATWHGGSATNVQGYEWSNATEGDGGVCTEYGTGIATMVDNNPSPVPLPAGALLIATALGAFGFIRRKG